MKTGNDWIKKASCSQIVAFAILVLTTSAYAQNCQPVPDSCMNASNQAQQLINAFPSTTGIYDSASQAYCAVLVGIEVNSFCADQYRAEGREACANAVDQQVAAYQSAQPGIEATISDISINQIRRACDWER